MNVIRVVGDVHGKYNQYMNVIHNSEYSVQLGDMGFNYGRLNELDADKHVFFYGNHDNRDCIVPPHNLNKYGIYSLNGITFFFVSGGFSIDKEYRKQLEASGKGRCWWPNEELDVSDMNNCLSMYQSSRPDFVITHEQPTVMVDKVGIKGILPNFGFDEGWKSNTQKLLQAMYEVHQPKLWIAGHFHRRMIWKEGKTKFVSLEELGYVDINENLDIV